MDVFLTIVFICVGLVAIKSRQENVRTKKVERKWYDL